MSSFSYCSQRYRFTYRLEIKTYYFKSHAGGQRMRFLNDFQRKTSLFFLSMLLLLAQPSYADENTVQVSSLQKQMLFRSFVQDAKGCKLHFNRNNNPLFHADVAQSAASSCPDAFAWVQLAKSIKNKWWEWGLDQTVWPAKPWPLCTDGKSKNCCDPNKLQSTQPTHCPAFRADYANPSNLPAVPNGSPSDATLDHRGLNGINQRDPDRLLRDLEVELVFRNKVFTDYVYRNDLYSKEGLGARNRAQNSALSSGDIAKAHSLEVRFPTEAVMVKADFIHQDVMLARGLIKPYRDGKRQPNDHDHPYLTVYLEGDSSNDHNVPGYYYMVAMTNASKTLPQWHWYAMEHVSNRGRCDYIGCNDSFGYRVNPVAQAGANFGEHYIPPHLQYNNDKTGGDNNNDALFKTGQQYLVADTGEMITDQLKTLFSKMGIATSKKDRNEKEITIDDPAWLNYRLKGTQTQFYHASGIPTGMGASITEGGFVNSASCLTCHAQASVDANGNSGMQGVGATWRPNLNGLTQVAMGAPDMNGFYGLGGPSINATQIDFVWGILGAQCVKPKGDGNCKNYPNQPTVIDKK